MVRKHEPQELPYSAGLMGAKVIPDHGTRHKGRDTEATGLGNEVEDTTTHRSWSGRHSTRAWSANSRRDRRKQWLQRLHARADYRRPSWPVSAAVERDGDIPGFGDDAASMVGGAAGDGIAPPPFGSLPAGSRA